MQVQCKMPCLEVPSTVYSRAATVPDGRQMAGGGAAAALHDYLCLHSRPQPSTITKTVAQITV